MIIHLIAMFNPYPVSKPTINKNIALGQPLHCTFIWVRNTQQIYPQVSSNRWLVSRSDQQSWMLDAQANSSPHHKMIAKDMLPTSWHCKCLHSGCSLYYINIFLARLSSYRLKALLVSLFPCVCVAYKHACVQPIWVHAGRGAVIEYYFCLKCPLKCPSLLYNNGFFFFLSDLEKLNVFCFQASKAKINWGLQGCAGFKHLKQQLIEKQKL